MNNEFRNTMPIATQNSVSMYVASCIALAIGSFLLFAAWWVFDHFEDVGSTHDGVAALIAYCGILLSAASGSCLCFAGGAMAIAKGWAVARSHVDAIGLYLVHMLAIASIILSAIVCERILFTPAGMIVGLVSAHVGMACLSCGVAAAWLGRWTMVRPRGVGRALTIVVFMMLAFLGVVGHYAIDASYWNRGTGEWDMTPRQMAWRLNVLAPIVVCQCILMVWAHWIMARMALIGRRSANSGTSRDPEQARDRDVASDGEDDA